jgi:acyl-CoA synthetase (AMP-forming)/AMP-acid ligase II
MAKLSESYGGPLPEKIRSMWELFLAAVDKYPDNLALVCVHQAHDLFGIPSQPLDDDAYRQGPYLRWTYKHFREGIARVGAGLKNAGVRPGSPIFTFLPNNAEYALVR